MLLTSQKQANVPQAPSKSKLQAFVQPRACSSFIKYIWTNLSLLSPQIFLVYLMWYIPSQKLPCLSFHTNVYCKSSVTTTGRTNQTKCCHLVGTTSTTRAYFILYCTWKTVVIKVRPAFFLQVYPTYSGRETTCVHVWVYSLYTATAGKT